MPPHGWRTMFWVVDQSGRVLVGPRERVPEDGSQRSIMVNGVEVGRVIASPVERLTRNTDINFDRQQKRTSWLIVALATLLAALATFPLARGLLAPVKRLVQKAKEAGRVIDATQGRRTKAVLVTEEDHVILSALQPDTLGRRMSAGAKEMQWKGEDDE